MARESAIKSTAALVMLLCAWGGPSAGEVHARLEIRVTDSTGSPSRDADVHASSSRRGDAVARGLTDAAGVVRFFHLPPSPGYRVVITARDGSTWTSGELYLRSGGLTVLEAVLLPPGEATDEEARPRLLDPGETSEGSSLSADLIEQLPVIGRTYFDLLTLTPGVTDPDLDGSPNVQGARETGLQVRQDGRDVTDPASGEPGMNLDFHIIEELEVISAGASVAYGRADGGFANIITRSGGNDLEGTARFIYQGSFLNGEVDAFGGTSSDFHDLHSAFTLGGPVLKDRLWYFGSVRRLNAGGLVEAGGESHSTSREGWDLFAKLTWQPGLGTKLSFQVSADPRSFERIQPWKRADSESGYGLEQGGMAWQVSWRQIVLPNLQVEARLSGWDSGVSTDPVSAAYHPFTVPIIAHNALGKSLQTVYPTRECSADGTASGFVPNCDPTLGRISLFHADLHSGRISGPSWFRLDDDRERTSARGDVTLSLSSAAAGEHLVRGGVEYIRETYEDSSDFNPFLQDATLPCTFCRDINGNPIPNAVTGFQLLTVPVVQRGGQLAEGESTALYLSDSWKPIPGLAVNAGIRLDIEQVDADGLSSFDPDSEKRRSVRMVEGLCAEGFRAIAVGNTTGNTTHTACDGPAYSPFFGTAGRLVFPLDPNSPAWVRALDWNMDKVFDSAVDRLITGQVAWEKPLTRFDEVGAEPYGIRNENLSPRVGVAWDPWRDGKTRIFGSWGRYYDRIRLGVTAMETGSVFNNFTFTPIPNLFQFVPGQLSRDLRGPAVLQIDRNLETPRTDVLTLGGEREVAPDWSVKLTYTQRQATRLQQDSDINHATCRDLDTAVGADPATVCPLSIQPGGQIVLGDDLFGAPGAGTSNGLTDLYTLSPFFGQVLRVESSGSSTYRGVTLELGRRQSRGWSVSGAYTWSKAEGGGMTAISQFGNDPAVRVVEAPLDTDQQHRLVVYGAASLPASVDLGWAIRWESGVPWSRRHVVLDEDSSGGLATRVRYPSGGRNERTSDDVWLVDARVARHFPFGRVTVSAELAAENLLGREDEVVDGFSESISSQLRRPGRTLEAGMVIRF